MFLTKILAADCTINIQLQTVKVKKITMQENCWRANHQDCGWGMEESRALLQDCPTISSSVFAADALDKVNFLVAEWKCKRDGRSLSKRCNFNQGRGNHWQDTYTEFYGALFLNLKTPKVAWRPYFLWELNELSVRNTYTHRTAVYIIHLE